MLCFHIKYKLFFMVILWSLFHILVSPGLNRYYICRAINSPQLQFCKQDNYNFRGWLLSTKRNHMQSYHHYGAHTLGKKTVSPCENW